MVQSLVALAGLVGFLIILGPLLIALVINAMLGGGAGGLDAT